MKQTTTQLEFAARPKVTAVKAKYREETRFDGTNLMNDPRVVRGNTYAAIVENKTDVPPPPKRQPKQQNPPKRRERRPNFDTGFEVSTPRAVSGREHFSGQTEAFVETLRDRPIMYEKEVQSDLFLDRPVEREFDASKGKTGVDRTTQIEENDAELFDFDYEVQPIVEALLSKILETSRMELHEESTLKAKEAEKEEFERRRHARLAEAQKLQANEARLKEEYDRRALQYRRADEREAATHRKLIGRALSKQFLSRLRPNTFAVLQAEGFFRPPLQTALNASFAPWLYEQTLAELHARDSFSEVAGALLLEAGNELLKMSTKAVAQEQERRRQINAEKEEARQKREAKRIEKARLMEEAERQKQEEQNAPQQQQA